VTRWIKIAGIVAGAAVSAAVLATGAFAGDEVATPADPAVKAATDKACSSLAPALRQHRGIRTAPAPAVPTCADADGVTPSWRGPGTVATQSGPAPLAGQPAAPQLPKLPEEPAVNAQPPLPAKPDPQLPAQPHLGGEPQLPAQPNLSGLRRLPATPDLPGKPDLPAQPDVAVLPQLPL
jgi:hypothetical protein